MAYDFYPVTKHTKIGPIEFNWMHDTETDEVFLRSQDIDVPLNSVLLYGTNDQYVLADNGAFISRALLKLIFEDGCTEDLGDYVDSMFDNFEDNRERIAVELAEMAANRDA